MQQHDRDAEGGAHSAKCEEREPILLPQPMGPGTAQRGRLPGGEKSGGCDTRRLHHFDGSQALTVKPPVLTRQNPEHYRGGPPVFARRGAAAEDGRAIAHVQRAVAGCTRHCELRLGRPWLGGAAVSAAPS